MEIRSYLPLLCFSIITQDQKRTCFVPVAAIRYFNRCLIALADALGRETAY
jgi:hypothetical protein